MAHGLIYCCNESLRENERVAFTSLSILVEHAIEGERFDTPLWCLKALARRIWNTPPGGMTLSVEWICGLLGTTPSGLRLLISDLKKTVAAPSASTLRGFRILTIEPRLDMVTEEMEPDMLAAFLERLSELSTYSRMA